MFQYLRFRKNLIRLDGIQRVSELQKMVLLTSKPYHLLRFWGLFNWLNNVPSVFRKVIVSLTKVPSISQLFWSTSFFFFLYMKNFGMRDLFPINIFLYFNNFGLKNQNRPYRLKFGTSTNPAMWNSMVIFSFSDLEQKYSFSTNLL